MACVFPFDPGFYRILKNLARLRQFDISVDIKSEYVAFGSVHGHCMVNIVMIQPMIILS